MQEKPKRLIPAKSTLIRLFAKTRNTCTYPGCENEVFDRYNNFICEVAHIEGVLPGSPRYNAKTDNSEKQDYENLIILCGHHHNVVDKQYEYYTVSDLKTMKNNHELSCLNNEDVISQQKLNSVLVNMYEVNEKLDVIISNQNLSRHKEDPIEWIINENSRKLVSKQHANKIFAFGSMSVTIIFLVPILFFYDAQLSFLSYFLVIPILFLVVFISLIISNFASKGEEIFNGSYFSIKKPDGNIEVYEKFAMCNWPKCNGVVKIFYPPEREKNNYDVIGRCSCESKDHTFTYQQNGLGYYRKMDFSPIERPSERKYC